MTSPCGPGSTPPLTPLPNPTTPAPLSDLQPLFCEGGDVVSARTTNKYEFMSGKSFSHFLDEPQSGNFTVKECFVHSNEVFKLESQVKYDFGRKNFMPKNCEEGVRFLSDIDLGNTSEFGVDGFQSPHFHSAVNKTLTHLQAMHLPVTSVFRQRSPLSTFLCPRNKGETMEVAMEIYPGRGRINHAAFFLLLIDDMMQLLLLCSACSCGPSESVASGGKDKTKKPGRYIATELENIETNYFSDYTGFEIQIDSTDVDDAIDTLSEVASKKLVQILLRFVALFLPVAPIPPLPIPSSPVIAYPVVTVLKKPAMDKARFGFFFMLLILLASGIDSKNVIITVFVCDNAEMMLQTEGRHSTKTVLRFAMLKASLVATVADFVDAVSAPGTVQLGLFHVFWFGLSLHVAALASYVSFRGTKRSESQEVNDFRIMEYMRKKMALNNGKANYILLGGATWARSLEEEERDEWMMRGGDLSFCIPSLPFPISNALSSNFSFPIGFVFAPLIIAFVFAISLSFFLLVALLVFVVGVGNGVIASFASWCVRFAKWRVLRAGKGVHPWWVLLTVRHSVSTKYICGLNKRLRKEHRSVIAGTPFRWFLDLIDNVKNLIPPKVAIEKKSKNIAFNEYKFGRQPRERSFGNWSGMWFVVNDDVDVGTMKDKNDLKDEPRQKIKDDKSSTKKLLKRKRRESFMQTLDHQRSVVKELKRRVVVLEEEVTFEKAKRRRPKDGEHSVPREEPSISSGGISPGGMSTDPPPMKTYVRMGSRRRYKSLCPYAGFDSGNRLPTSGKRLPLTCLLHKCLDFTQLAGITNMDHFLPLGCPNNTSHTINKAPCVEVCVQILELTLVIVYQPLCLDFTQLAGITNMDHFLPLGCPNNTSHTINKAPCVEVCVQILELTLVIVYQPLVNDYHSLICCTSVWTSPNLLESQTWFWILDTKFNRGSPFFVHRRPSYEFLNVEQRCSKCGWSCLGMQGKYDVEWKTSNEFNRGSPFFVHKGPWHEFLNVEQSALEVLCGCSCLGMQGKYDVEWKTSNEVLKQLMQKKLCSTYPKNNNKSTTTKKAMVQGDLQQCTPRMPKTPTPTEHSHKATQTATMMMREREHPRPRTSERTRENEHERTTTEKDDEKRKRKL
ncbi:hypothetical protein V8G54_009027 [Vigna mungo]|uniref:Uncharacterized protein n=1 Tax=Vigna mungo TaxID=3915 RepID=A0AAQ3P4Z3_VIGMU